MIRWNHFGWRSVVSLLLASGCGGQVSSGAGRESHFLCESDADCDANRSGLTCVTHVCQSRASALSAQDGATSGSVAIGSGATDSAGATGTNTAAAAGGATGFTGATEGGASTGSAGTTDSVGPTNAGGTVGTIPNTGGATSGGDAGPPVNSEGTGSASGFDNYIFGGVTSDGHLVAAYWNGPPSGGPGVEATVLIDPATGGTSFGGNLGDLYMWQGQFVYNDATRVAYAVGQDRGGANHIYALSLDTQKSTSSNFTSDPADSGIVGGPYTVGGVTSDGHLVAAYWNGSPSGGAGVEAAVLIDPATGGTSFVGNLGDLYMWQGQFVYNDATRFAYAVGQDRAGANHIYSLSLDTQKSTSSNFTSDPADSGIAGGPYTVGGVTSDGHLVAAYWNGPRSGGAGVEATVLIDPATGGTSFVGNLGDLYMWEGQLLYGGAAPVIYAFGQDRAGVSHFYTLPLGG